MKKLYDYIASALAQQESTKGRYEMICRGLVRYQEEFPFYFDMVLSKINIDFENRAYLPEEKETYLVGEEINEKLRDFLTAGMETGSCGTIWKSCLPYFILGHVVRNDTACSKQRSIY